MTTYQIVMSGPLGTYDITSRTLSANWSRSLGESASTLDLECINIQEYHVMDTVTLTVDGVLCFTGVVKSQSESYDETVKRISLKCIDNTDKLYHVIVAEKFENKTAKEIITELRNQYVPWVGITDVDDVGGPIEEINFNYEPLAECINKLAEINGAYWHIDALDRMTFFQDIQGFAPIDFTPERILMNSFSLDYSAVELVNRVWVIGARQSSPTAIEQTFSGDNSNQYFLLAYVPNYPKVYENGVQKTISLAKDEEADTDYVYNKTEKVLKRVAGNLQSGVALRIEYQPTVQVIDYFEDSSSVTRYGRYERVIRDRKITDKMAARKRGRSELKRVKDVIRYAKFNSRTWQVSPGEVTRVIMPTFTLNSNFRINAIDVSFTPEDIVASVDVEEVKL
jgi:hypothetical protein